ncbi:MAG: M36 family metallopeptidase, partial [Nonlabens sp.]|nr:M36 family metallopeptidase [Nonlabens sp.]
TYASTNNAQFSRPHGVGSVWATMLWDLTWRFIDDYGFDPDVYNGTGGNNIVMQLVMDGLKLQPCSPGFVDGRDAILLADSISNNGVNRDRIWEVFAARGLGASALQGSSDDRFDQTEAFDVPAPLSVNDVLANQIKVFPNPSTGLITLSSLEVLTDVSVSVVDLNGRVLLQTEEKSLSVLKLDLSFLSNGVYLLNINTPLGNQATKVIINK